MTQYQLKETDMKRPRFDSPVTEDDEDNDSSYEHESPVVDNKSPLIKASSRMKNRTSPHLSTFPQLLTALQADPSIIVACHNAFNDLVYLSDSGYQTMGIDALTPLNSMSFPVSPSRGAIFFRQHTDGSLVQYRNTFKSIQDNGEVFTIDERMPNVEKRIVTLLVNPLSSEVTQCGDLNSAWTSSFQVGKQILNMFTKDNFNRVMMALTDASKGRSSYNILATSNSMMNTRFSMDFHPCTSDQVVVLVSFLSDVKRTTSDIIHPKYRNVLPGHSDKYVISQRDEMQKKQLLAEIKEREAVAASKTKSEFLAVMSHELRTPLNGVLGATSLLGITSLNDEQRDYVSTITDSADILLSLISNILDISKIENGKFELEKVPLRVVDTFRKCADLMKYRAYQKGLTITTEIDSDLNDASVWHRGDPTRLNQVLLNFVSNAVKFTRTGGVTCKLLKLNSSGLDEIGDSSVREARAGVNRNDDQNSVNETYSCRASSHFSNRTDGSIQAAYDWLRIEVTDTGCGIADTSMLFAPFVQANKFIHKKYGGTGLGLNISKQIVELMRGRVGITSTEGVGTTVWAEIPMPRASAPRKGPDFVPSSPSDVDLVRRRYVSRPSFGANNEDLTKKVRILIAEDMLVNQKVLKRMLETLGYTDITIANNGQEAVDAIKQSWDDYMVNPKCCSRFDIVLMDCLMPVMDGWSATEAIRSLEADYLIRTETESATYVDTYPIIILALTANATEEDKSRCRECGMDDFYTKPMPRDRLNAMMLRWVSILFADETADKESDNSTQCSIGEL
jgi:signal transduction histidine kinase/CheY-like chemotaxis protein